MEAVILALVFEGVMFALFPASVREAMIKIMTMSDQQLRALGGMALASALVLGIVMRWLS